ncbi:AzlC family ABC transporter permease [Priestia megaterium]|nr:AzlC family ABC transporter permease [Priestia megaterium]
MGELELEIETEKEKEPAFRDGITAALPIIIGYVPIAITFGMIGVQSGVSLFHTVMMSILVFAGASQFVGVGMIAAGASSMTIIVTTLVLNLRHFIMSLSLMNKLPFLSLNTKAFLAFGVTDETFAVASLHKKHSKPFLVGLISSAYLTWVIGTLLGGLLANFIPKSISAVMAVSLYALFIGLLVPSIRENVRILAVVLLSVLLSYLFSMFLPSGWAIVLATVLASSIGIFIRIEEEK